MADPPPETECVRFLAALACGAPEPTLAAAWEALGPARDESVGVWAARLGVASALGVFVSRHAGRLPSARELVAVSLLQIQKSRAALALLKRLAAHPAVHAQGAVVVKGAALALLGLVGDERSFSDADVVVHPDHLETWSASAASLGASWRPQHGYEAAYVELGAGLVEIHTALPGFFGTEAGPGPAELAALRVATPCPGLHALAAPAAREVCVQHFVFHHDGAPLHALRALQDLCALQGAGEGTGLPWAHRTAEVQRATRHLRSLARAFRAGEWTEDQQQFVRTLALVAGQAPGGFAHEVDRWMSGEASRGRSRAALVARRVFLPAAQMRARADEATLLTLGRYAARPPLLLYRYLRGRLAKAPQAGLVASWRRLLRG